MFSNLLIVLMTFWPKYTDSSFIFDWLGWSDKKGPNLTYKGVPLLQIPFEELPPEDKFLVEASKIVGFDLSELDACQHRLVIKLKSSCSSLSEEDLAKFSVNLLNCQSAVEGRKEYPCEDKMSLKECTSAMDKETWNAYHIMNNRARAVCYASRQQQFQALTEMIVNKLTLTVRNHIETLSSLQKESSNLKGGASLTLREIERSQRDVLNRQRSLASISLLVGDEIQQSLSAVTNQKQLLTDFRKDLANLLNKLQNKLDNAEKQVAESTGSVKSGHGDLMKDMKELSDVASQILNKIDDSSKKVLENNDMTLEQFKEALENMKEINLSIRYIQSVVKTIKERSTLISSIVGEKGERLELCVLLMLHCLCLIAAMVVASFLSVPFTSRVALLFASSLNAYTSVASISEENLNYPTVDLAPFYCGFGVIAICDWLIRCLIKLIMDRRSKVQTDQIEIKDNKLNNSYTRMACGENPTNDVKINDIHSRSPLINKFNSSFDETPVTNKVNNWLTENRYRSPNLNGFVKDSQIDDEVHSHVSSVGRSFSARSVDGKSICTAVSKHTGQRCRKKANKNSNYCSIHDR